MVINALTVMRVYRVSACVMHCHVLPVIEGYDLKSVYSCLFKFEILKRRHVFFTGNVKVTKIYEHKFHKFMNSFFLLSSNYHI